ncbi:Flp pilus assembly complex ATPase component TadA [Candidatus Woesearchaeota archaeon]|nr:Flp pilus assembly complex ATPase component TadA [Candidatus Woesearchaeota archaeon]
MEEKTYVVDTSVVVERLVSQFIKSKKISGKIIVPKAVMAELEHQANTGQEIGFLGLEEVQNLQKLFKEGKITLMFTGERPNLYQIAYAKQGGEIDAIIRDIAYNEGAILVTADRIQAESAKALGVEVIYSPHRQLTEALEIEQYFDYETMSVHLREGCPPRAKKGKPGEWKLLDVATNILTQQEVQEMAKEIVERSRIESDAFIEISRPGSTIVQYKNYRIVITKTPVSDGWEITAVRPIKVLKIDDYNLPTNIAERVKTKARGVIIAGTTGSGKSTFAQSLAEYYATNSFITKTIESPRSLILSKDVTQYSKNLASSEEIHDILFLSRPDYIIFDEMRDTPDFILFTDLRLGGSNVLGVLHAATPIDAIQRFIGRLEVGMIPSVLDTLIFIEKGNVSRILTVQMIVKVPSGMTEADLARPVIEVRDYITNKLEFEIYSYGEETVVIPVQEEFLHDPTKALAAKQLERELRAYVNDVKVKIINNNRAEVYLPEDEIAKFIGKEGKNISQIEKKLGFGLTVKELKEVIENEESDKIPINYKVEESKKALVFKLPQEHAGKIAEVYVDGHFLLTYTIGNKAELKINKKSKLGQELLKDLDNRRKIEVRV